MEVPFNLTAALETDILGQKRTGKHKQFVFLHDDYAIKGPYSPSKLNNVTIRSQIFTRWASPCVVVACDQFTTTDGTFVKYPNFMSSYTLESELHTESFSTLQYKILKNAPVIDVGHAIPTNPWIYPLLEDVLISLCHCNILGVGDMNVRNTLVNPKTQQFYIIDF